MPKQQKTISALRQEYYNLRKTFNKRINRLSKGTKAQRQYAAPFQPGGKRAFKTLTELGEVAQNEKLLKREIRDLKLYLKKDRLSLSGWKNVEKETVKSLQRAGYNITKKNLSQFGEFMEKMRQLYGNKIFPSEEIAESYDRIAEGTRVSNSVLNELISSISGGINGVDLFL